MNQQRGMSITEVMVAAAVLLIAALATAQFFANSFRSSHVLKTLKGRDEIAKRIEEAMNDPLSYLLSTEPAARATCPDCNNVLTACLQGLVGTICPDPGAVPQGIPFTLFAREENQARPFAGHETRGRVFYGEEGGRGDFANRGADAVNVQDFPYEVRSYFRPTRVNPATNIADSIVAQFQIIYRPPPGGPEHLRRTVGGPDGVSVFGADALNGTFVFPKWFNRTDWTSGIEMETKEVNLIRSLSCRPGETLVGFDRTGLPVCRCRGNTNNAGVCEPAICGECPPGNPGCDREFQRTGQYRDIEIGFDVNALNSLCFPRKRVFCEGWRNDTNCFRPDDEDEPVFSKISWIGGIRFDECYDTSDPSTKGSPSATEIECTNKQVRCCFEAFQN